jgi:predicted DNA-binding transcriptional regulator YafY
VVRALFDKEIAPWVREARSYFVVDMEEKPEGLLVMLRVRMESEIVQWLLGWGGSVRVLEPDSLRRRLVEEGKRIIENNRNL